MHGSADKKVELRKRYGDRHATMYDGMVDSYGGDVDGAEFESLVVGAAAKAASAAAPAASGKAECPVCKKQFKSAVGRDDHMKSTGHSAAVAEEVCGRML